MGLKKFRPITSTTRYKTVLDFSDITTATFKANDGHKHEYLYHNTETAEWSKDFVVMQFDKDPNTIYEHDNEHGIAINENDNVIVLWEECAS